MIRVGNVKVVAISDLDLPPRVALDEIWPNVAERDWLPFQQRFPRVFGDEGRWHNHVGCFLIQTRNALMLVDTGIGPMIGGTLLDKLTALGVAPSDIDTVFLTHLHIDHVGGALTKAGVPTFPRARYVLHRAEWDARAQHAARAESLGQPPYVDRIVTPLADLGVLDLVDGEHALAPDITAIPTPGHSPGHMSVIVASDGERAIVLGDVLLHPAQVTEPDWSSRMDMDGDAARVMRYRILDRAEAEAMTMAAGHVRGTSFGRIVREDGRRYWHDVAPEPAAELPPS